MVAHGHDGDSYGKSMPVLRAEKALRLNVDTSAWVTLALRVTPSGEEGVGASASSVSRLCLSHAVRIRVQSCLVSPPLPAGAVVLLGRGAGINL